MRRIFLWTERQDALFETLTNHQIAARTGKTPRQVTARRQRLKARRSSDVWQEQRAAQIRDAVEKMTGGENLNLVATIPEFRATGGWTSAELQTLAKVTSGEQPESELSRSTMAAQCKVNRMLSQGFIHQFTFKPITP